MHLHRRKFFTAVRPLTLMLVLVALAWLVASGENRVEVDGSKYTALPEAPALVDESGAPASQRADRPLSIATASPAPGEAADFARARADDPWQADTTTDSLAQSVIYADEFDRGFELWDGDKNLWQMGSPVAGPQNLCADDSMCIGTLLDAAYPDFVNAELRSPPIDLPRLRAGESIELTASSWFDVHLTDSARILVSWFDGEVWVDPEVLLSQGGKSAQWQSIQLELSRFAGKKIRLHLSLEQAEELEGVGDGWYIDDLRLIKKSELKPWEPA